MPNDFPIKLCKLLLLLNIIFWSAMAVGYSIYMTGYPFIKIALFFEPLFFASALFGIIKKNKVIFYLALIFTFCNTLLSITDEIGWLDVLSAMLSLAVFVNLLIIKKNILNKI